MFADDVAFATAYCGCMKRLVERSYGRRLVCALASCGLAATLSCAAAGAQEQRYVIADQSFNRRRTRRGRCKTKA